MKRDGTWWAYQNPGEDYQFKILNDTHVAGFDEMEANLIGEEVNEVSKGCRESRQHKYVKVNPYGHEFYVFINTVGEVKLPLRKGSGFERTSDKSKIQGALDNL